MGWLIIDYPQNVDNRVYTLNTRWSDFPAWSHPDAGLTSACERGINHPKKGSTLTPFQVPSALISRVVDWICFFLLRQFDEQMLKFRTGAVAEPLNPEIESASSLLMTPQNVMKCHHSTTKVGKSGKGGPVQGTDANRSPVPGRDISQKRQLSYQPKPRVVRQISEKISLQRLDPDLTMKQRRIKRNHVIIWGFRKMVVPQNHRLQFEY